MPLIRRVPKRGFNNARHRVEYIPINVASLMSFEAGSTVDPKALRDSGIARGPVKRIKVLGDGDLDRRLIVHADAFSASARIKIEAAGGECHVVAPSGAPAKA